MLLWLIRMTGLSVAVMMDAITKGHVPVQLSRGQISAGISAESELANGLIWLEFTRLSPVAARGGTGVAPMSIRVEQAPNHRKAPQKDPRAAGSLGAAVEPVGVLLC